MNWGYVQHFFREYETTLFTIENWFIRSDIKVKLPKIFADSFPCLVNADED